MARPTPSTRVRWRLDDAACTGCGACVDACPAGALTALGADTVPTWRPSACDGCAACVRECPVEALLVTVEPAQRPDEA